MPVYAYASPLRSFPPQLGFMPRVPATAGRTTATSVGIPYSRPGRAHRRGIKKAPLQSRAEDIGRQGQMIPLPRHGENQSALLWFPPKRLVAPNSPCSPNRHAASRKFSEADYPVSRVPNNPWAGAYNLSSAGNLFGISSFDGCTQDDILEGEARGNPDPYRRFGRGRRAVGCSRSSYLKLETPLEKEVFVSFRGRVLRQGRLSPPPALWACLHLASAWVFRRSRPGPIPASPPRPSRTRRESTWWRWP
jgi:hypothetical protein